MYTIYVKILTDKQIVDFKYLLNIFKKLFYSIILIKFILALLYIQHVLLVHFFTQKHIKL